MASSSRRRPPVRRAPTQQLALPLEVPAPPQLITVLEARRWLGISAEAFAKLLCSGCVPVVHLGRKPRIEDTALLAWLADHRPFQGLTDA
jgi:hypothetical protein